MELHSTEGEFSRMLSDWNGFISMINANTATNAIIPQSDRIRMRKPKLKMLSILHGLSLNAIVQRYVPSDQQLHLPNLWGRELFRFRVRSSMRCRFTYIHRAMRLRTCIQTYIDIPNCSKQCLLWPHRIIHTYTFKRAYALGINALWYFDQTGSN